MSSWGDASALRRVSPPPYRLTLIVQTRLLRSNCCVVVVLLATLLHKACTVEACDGFLALVRAVVLQPARRDNAAIVGRRANAAALAAGREDRVRHESEEAKRLQGSSTVS